MAKAVHWNEAGGAGGVVAGWVRDEANGGAGVEEMGGAEERARDEGWTVSAETELLTTAEGHEVAFSWKKKGTDQQMWNSLLYESPTLACHTTKDKFL